MTLYSGVGYKITSKSTVEIIIVIILAFINNIVIEYLMTTVVIRQF